jgi:O-acetyl-ADP-ribose deacetylase (regulator of RNase III)
MERVVNDVTLSLVQGDITQQEVDAIVNAANSSLMGGGGVDGAIHRAGGPAILQECMQRRKEIGGYLPPGKAVITTGGKLPARYVIHTVGPIWHDGNRGEAQTLASAYRESLSLAASKGVETIAFPSISTGAYRYPVEEAAKVAIQEVVSFLKKSPGPLKEVRFVLYNAPAYSAYVQALEEAVPNGR